MPSSSTPNPHPDPTVQALDTLFRGTGLVSNLRGKSRFPSRVRCERTEPEELRQAAPSPRVAANGVEWLSVPGWERIHWLWHGFSTRRGGLSRAYCSEDAPGELNLGFTEADD